jgi:hypothetical protein
MYPLFYLTFSGVIILGMFLFFYFIKKKGAVFKYFTLTNILVGIFTVLVISVTK